MTSLIILMLEYLVYRSYYSPSGLDAPTLPVLLTLLGFALVAGIPTDLSPPAVVGFAVGLTAVLDPATPVALEAEAGLALADMVVLFNCDGLAAFEVPTGTVFFAGAPAGFFWVCAALPEAAAGFEAICLGLDVAGAE